MLRAACWPHPQMLVRPMRPLMSGTHNGLIRDAALNIKSPLDRRGSPDQADRMRTYRSFRDCPMNLLLKEIRHNPLLWLLAFVPVVFAAQEAQARSAHAAFRVVRPGHRAIGRTA